MNDSYDEIKTDLLGYSDLYVAKSGPNLFDTYDVYDVPNIDNSFCPFPGCMSHHTQMRGTRPHTVHDLVYKYGIAIPIIVNYHQQRFYCVKCRHSYLAKTENYPPKLTVTDRLKAYIYFLSLCDLTHSLIENLTELTFDAVDKICSEVRKNLRRKEMQSCALLQRRRAPKRELIIKEITLNQRSWTLICDLSNYTVLLFSAGKAASVLTETITIRSESEKQAKYDKIQKLDQILLGAQTVIVDPDCNFLSELKNWIHPACKIVVNQNDLYSGLCRYFMSETKMRLSSRRANKLNSMLSAIISNEYNSYFSLTHKEYSFFNRAAFSDETIKNTYCAINAVREKIGKRALGEGILADYDLLSFLIDKKLIAPELKDVFSNWYPFDDSPQLFQFEELTTVISSKLLQIPKTKSDKAIEDTFFYSVPGKYRFSSGYFYSESRLISSFADVPNDAEYLGKTFDSIKANLRYREEVMAGSRTYSGPDII